MYLPDPIGGLSNVAQEGLISLITQKGYKIFWDTPIGVNINILIIRVKYLFGPLTFNEIWN